MGWEQYRGNEKAKDLCLLLDKLPSLNSWREKKQSIPNKTLQCMFHHFSKVAADFGNPIGNLNPSKNAQANK